MKFAGKVAHFEDSDAAIETLRAIAPEAVVTTLSGAIRLADARLSDPSRVPKLSFALIVLTDLSGPELDDQHRDLFWRAFQVPIFEQLRDWDGNVIARECEAHDGLHLVSGTDARLEQRELWVDNRRTDIEGSIVADACECGGETVRLQRLRKVDAVADAA
ncbi:MAG TPA: hypothetical protein VKB79_30460 [Bryobacteraceae bacterium]|nr:hypothetical protein [Bryobacteraceae bacterium]